MADSLNVVSLCVARGNAATTSVAPPPAAQLQTLIEQALAAEYAVPAVDVPGFEAAQQECDALYDVLHSVIEGTLAATVRCWDDVAKLAVIANYLRDAGQAAPRRAKDRSCKILIEAALKVGGIHV